MIQDFLNELIIWNKTHNLVSKNEILNLQEHIDDSLSLTPLLPESGLIVDIGSGGGFPVIPLAIWAKMSNKNLEFIATDVVDKKIAFLQWCGAKFDLALDVVKVDKRFLVDESCVITSRAFATIKNIIEWQVQHAPHATEFLLPKGDKALLELEEAHITVFDLIKNPRGNIVRFKK